MKKYLRTSLLQIKQLSIYKLEWYGWLIAFPLQLFMTILLWKIIYQKTDIIGGFTFVKIVQYYIYSFVLMRVLSPMLEVNYLVWSDINKGDLSNYISRPLIYGFYMFSKRVAISLREIAIGIIVIGFCVLFGFVELSLNINLCYFIFSVILSIIIVYLYQFIIGSLTFWMERIFGIRDIVFTIFMIFSGNLIPISMFSESIQNVSKYMPFQSIFYAPISIITGNNQTTLYYLVQQLLWSIILVALSSIIWKKGIIKYAAQGG